MLTTLTHQADAPSLEDIARQRADATRDTRRGRDHGPYDITEAIVWPTGRHRLEGYLHTTSMILPIPYHTTCEVESACGIDEYGHEVADTPRAAHLHLPTSTYPYRPSHARAVITVLAAPASETLWHSHLAQQMADRAREFATVTELVGPFGWEIVTRSTTQDACTIGIDGPRWTLLATLYTDPGHTLTPDHFVVCDQILADTIITRGTHAAGPGWPLDLTCQHPPDPIYTPTIWDTQNSLAHTSSRNK